MSDVLPFAAVPAEAVLLVGGKGLSLARTAAAGLPVPPGFVVTTDAYRANRAGHSEALKKQVEAAYVALGGGPVAVRSSATAEDGADTSFAGQQETILGVEGIEPLLIAIQRCWQSLYTERAVAYRKAQGIAEDCAAMAVVVQTLIPADVAGVLFTRDPADPTGTRMSVEASWGLGEAVVSGRVTPDRFTVDRETGNAIDRKPGAKTVRITPRGEEPVPTELQAALCLTDAQLAALAELGRHVEAVYGDPRDIEWAFANGELYLLQARPITAATAADRERIRKEIQAEVRRLADPTGTVWVRYNLSETLPEPTPMTWDITRVLLAATGGFGALNADLGGDPDLSLGMLGAFDLIAGRPMANLSRMPRLQFRRPPIEYPFAAYKRDPRKALDPEPELKPLRNGWLRLPGAVWRLSKIASRTRKLTPTFDKTFTGDIAPAFATETRAALSRDLSTSSPKAVVDQLRVWVRKTNVDFARHSLKPTVLAAGAMQFFADLLTPKLKDRAKAAVRELAAGAKAPAECALADGLHAFSSGMMSRAEFLTQFGHRCGGEMELARPRWSEDPTAVDALFASRSPAHVPAEDPWPRIAKEARLPASVRRQADGWVERLRTYLGLREAGKHYWLLGMAVIRRYLVELDARFKLNGGVFFLTLAELDDLLTIRAGSVSDGSSSGGAGLRAGVNEDTGSEAGATKSEPRPSLTLPAPKEPDILALIATRKKRRQLELTLELPPVLFSDDLDAIGRPLPVPDGAATMEGIALSAGVAEGPALVLTEPAPPPDGPFILVCPSTDPAWVPLFAKAKGLVMETGGVLSHGAIVAREFGLPAVAGLPGVVARLRTGQMLRVDGTRGVVSVVGSEPEA